MLTPTERPIFRESALARLASPEDLDRRLRVTPARGWVALLGLIVLIGAILVWSVLGRLPTYVTATGLLMTTGGYTDVVTAEGEGVLTRLSVRVGDTVTVDQEIGQVAAPDLRQRTIDARALVDEREAHLGRVRRAAASEAKARHDTIAARRVAAALQRDGARGRAVMLREKLRDEERLLAQSIVTRDTVMRTRVDLSQAEQSVADAEGRLLEMSAEENDIRFQTDQRVSEAEAGVAEAQRRLSEMALAERETTLLRARSAGKVVELQMKPGDQVSRGQAILSLVTEGHGLEMIGFVRFGLIGRIQDRMPARVSPGGTTRETTGSILAEVDSVTRFPLTAEAVSSLVRNELLVREFTQPGPPALVRLRLRLDPASRSGLAWTGRGTGPEEVLPGTAASAEIEVEARRPIEMVIPALRRLLGV